MIYILLQVVQSNYYSIEICNCVIIILDTMPRQKSPEQLLHSAINKYDIKQVENLLKKPEIMLNARVRRKTALGLATERQRSDIVELLLKANVDVNGVTQCECRQLDCPQTALAVAARVGSIEIIDILLRQISGSDVKEGKYDHVVFWAARCLYGQILSGLLQLGANPNMVGDSRQSLLATVCLSGYVTDYSNRKFTNERKLEACNMLVNSGACLGVFDMCDMLYLCHHGAFEVVHTLIYNGLDVVKMKTLKVKRDQINMSIMSQDTSYDKNPVPRSKEYYYITGRTILYLVSFFRERLGCFFHDKQLQFLYKFLAEDSTENVLPDDIKFQIRRHFHSVPSLLQLSRSSVRHRMMECNNGRSIVPSIKKLMCIPQPVKHQLLLTWEMQRPQNI